MRGFYNILHEDGRIEPVDGETWMRWRGANPAVCCVGDTDIGDVRVSTIFIGLDARATGRLFETMVLGGALDGREARYATLEEARAGHAVTVALIEKEGS